MSGSVEPLVGSRPMFTPMLMNACKPSQMPMPCAASAAKWRSRCVGLPADGEGARARATRNSAITSTTPTKPSSSAITASRKSVCASGR